MQISISLQNRISAIENTFHEFVANPLTEGFLYMKESCLEFQNVFSFDTFVNTQYFALMKYNRCFDETTYISTDIKYRMLLR